MAKIEFKSKLSSAVANSTFLLKTEATDIITAQIEMNNPEIESGASFTNLQGFLNQIAESVGVVGQDDPNKDIYSSENYITNGDNRKIAIGILDNQGKLNADAIIVNADLIADIIASIGVDAVTAPLGVGICDLDADGKIPTARIPDVLLQYQGTWNASTNVPVLSDATGETNHWYRVDVAGTQDLGSGSIDFEVNDKVVHNGTLWQKWDTTESVISVNAKKGVVVLDKIDIGLSNVLNSEQLTKQANSFNAGFVEKAVPVEADIVIIEDSEDSYNKKKVLLENMLGGGGGGGGSFVWELNAGDSPIESINNGFSTLDFDSVSNQEIIAMVTIPESYSTGNQIKLSGSSFFTPSITNNILFNTVTTLFKAGEDITADINTHDSVNVELTANVTANALTEIGNIDLSDGSGLINGVAIAPFDLLKIILKRDNAGETVSASEDAKLLRFSTSILFE
jgi:hypothetical protein